MNLTNPDVLFVEGLKNEIANTIIILRGHTNKNNTMTHDEDLQRDPEFQRSLLITTGCETDLIFCCRNPSGLLIMIETDNGETGTQPPVALPSTCPLPAASRFQQMPELIRAAYVSPRSHWCYFKAHSARGRRVVVYKGKYVESRYIFGFSIITACKDHPFSWVIFNSLPSLRFV